MSEAGDQLTAMLIEDLGISQERADEYVEIIEAMIRDTGLRVKQTRDV